MRSPVFFIFQQLILKLKLLISLISLWPDDGRKRGKGTGQSLSYSAITVLNLSNRKSFSTNRPSVQVNVFHQRYHQSKVVLDLLFPFTVVPVSIVSTFKFCIADAGLSQALKPDTILLVKLPVSFLQGLSRHNLSQASLLEIEIEKKEIIIQSTVELADIRQKRLWRQLGPFSRSFVLYTRQIRFQTLGIARFRWCSKR